MMKQFIALLVVLSSLLTACEAAGPLVVVPKTTSAPAIDGKLNDSVWQNAAQVSGFVIAGKGTLGRLPVTAQLLYDDRALYVGMTIPYDSKPALRGMQRPRDGAAWSDDAVEILLDPGPSGKDFHQIVVNYLGSLYDAKNNDTTWTADLQARTYVGDRGWTAEVAIVFASLGGAPKAGDRWGANFGSDALFAGPELSSWANTGGQYAEPSRFGTLVFGGDMAARIAPLALPTGIDWHTGLSVLSGHPATGQVDVVLKQGAAVVAETHQAVTTRSESPATVTLPVKLAMAGRHELDLQAVLNGTTLYSQHVEFKQAGALQLSAYNTAFGRQVDVALAASPALAATPDLTAEVTLLDPAGKTVGRPMSLRLAAGKAKVSLPLPAPVGKYSLLGVLRQGQQELSRTSESFDRLPTPAYFTTTAGLSDKVLSPFTPLQSAPGRFSCWGRTYDFAGGPFPATIKTHDAQVLAGPVRLVGSVGGQALTWKATPGKLQGATKTEATWLSGADAAGLKLDAKTLVEYDGCLTTDLKLDAGQGQTVDQLALEIPIKPEYARYIHSANATWVDSYSSGISGPGWKWERAFVPYVWLGDEWRGLAWFAETDEPFRLNDRTKSIQVLAEGKQVLLRINLIDHPVTLSGDLNWRFGLQATPVKAVPRRLPHLWHGAYYGMEDPAGGLGQRLSYPAQGNLNMRQGTIETIVTVNFDPAKVVEQKRNQTLMYLKAESGNTVVWFYDYSGQGLWFYVGLGAGYPQQYPIHITANKLGWKKGETHHLALTWGDKTRMYIDGKLAAESAPYQGWLQDPLDKVDLTFGSVSRDGSDWLLRDVSIASVPATAEELAVHAAALSREGKAYELPETSQTLLLDHLRKLDARKQLLPAAKLSSTGPVHGGQLKGPATMTELGLDLGTQVVGESLLDSLKAKGVEVVVYHSRWTEMFGQPTTIYGDRLRKLVKAVHAHDMKLIVYFGYGLANTTPQMKEYHDQWTVWPLIPWSGGQPEQTFDAGCNRGPIMEFLADGIEKLVHDYDIDGIYMDGTTEPFGCINYLHGCGYQRDGEWQKTYSVWRNREFMKRLYTIFHLNRKEPILDQHMSGNMIIPTLSFCDSYWDGEQFEGYKFGEQKALELLPLDSFRAEFMGKQWGLRAEFLNYEKRPFTMSEAMSFVLLHDMYVRATGTDQHLDLPATAWRIFDGFGTDKATWLPYWSQTAARPTPEGVYCSAYTRPDKGALLVISNLTGKPVRVRVNLDRKQLHLGPDVKQGTEQRTGQSLRLTGDTLRLQLGSMDYALVRLGK